MSGVSTIDRYESSLLVVFPRTLILGSLLALVHGGAILFTFDTFGRWAEVLAVTAFVLVLGTTVGVAIYGYSRRFYEFGDDGITEHRWSFRPIEKHVAYEEIEDVTMSQSLVQSLLGAGTLRINHIESDAVGDEEEMRIRFVDEPGAIYSNILSHTAEFHDAAPQRDVADLFDSHAVENASIFEDRLAAATGSTYLMPYAVATPYLGYIVWRLGFFGLYVSGGLTAIFALSLFPAPLQIVAVWAVVFVCYLGYGGYKLWSWSGRQYELYSEHAKIVHSNTVETISYDDIETVTFSAEDSRWGQVGSVVGRNADGDSVIEIEYITDPAEFARGFVAIADAELVDD